MSSPAFADGYDTPTQQSEDSTTFMILQIQAKRGSVPAAGGRRMHCPDAAICAASLSPRPQAAQHLLKWPSLPSSHLLCLLLSGAASLPTVPERSLPATPAVGALSSESTVHTLQRLRLRLTPAQTVPVTLHIRDGPLHGRWSSSTDIATSVLLTHWAAGPRHSVSGGSLSGSLRVRVSDRVRHRD